MLENSKVMLMLTVSCLVVEDFVFQCPTLWSLLSLS